MFSTSNSTTSNSSSSVQKPMKRPQKNNVFVNFLAGGVGGTAGVLVTCPLDVVQTRLQSSLVNLSPVTVGVTTQATTPVIKSTTRFGLHVFNYIKHIVKTEGFTSLYKGLVPNLFGIVPSRAIYFGVYTEAKSIFSSTSLANSSFTHMLSALSASWSVSTVTNPLWFMKTRLQLDLSAGKRRKILDVVKEVYQSEGIKGFYRGLSASYIGASETMIYFVIYEKLKHIVSEKSLTGDLTAIDYITAAFLSKTCATISVYPHEVVRTRLRQESSVLGSKKIYNSFMQTLKKVYIEEGYVGLYGGMGAHLMRQVPNTVIMFLTDRKSVV